MRRLAVLAALLGLDLSTGAWGAEPADPRTQAAALQVEGLKALDRRDAASALDRFRAAYGLVPSPKILFNMGRAYAELGDDAHSFECFDRFLAEATNVPPWSLVDAERTRSQLRPRLTFVEVVGPAAARVIVDGEPRGSLPLPRPLPLAPGRRVLQVASGGATLYDQPLTLQAGAVTRLVIDRPPTPPAVRVAPALEPRGGPFLEARHKEPPPPSLIQRWWFWPGVATVVLGAVAVGVAVSSGAFHSAGCPSDRRCM
jgi:hypothetical protein